MPFFVSCSNTSSNEHSIPNEIKLQTGDIVFRAGISFESSVVRIVDTKNIYSHIGIIIWYNNEWSVLHAVPNERKQNEKDSVKIEPLRIFFSSNRASSGAIYRLLGVANDTIALLNRCEEVYNRKPLFDDFFSLCDTNSFYCTELVWYIYKTALNIDLSQNRRHKIPMLPPIIFCSDLIAYPNLSLIYSFNSKRKQ